MNKTLIFFCLFLFCINPAAAAPERGDYDGDGRADLSVALVYREQGSTAWLTRHGADDFSFWTFGVPADALVAGHWFGDQKYYPGVIYVRSAQIPLEWYIKNAQNNDVRLSYGLPGDSIPNQGDLDCDGITDLAVTRNGSAQRFPGYKLWYIALSGSGGNIIETLFGLASDRVGTADLDGDGCHEMMVLRDGFFWFGRKLFGSDVSTVQWGLPGDIPLFPQDINGDTKADYIISRISGGGQLGYVRYSGTPGDFGTFALGSDSSVPQVGNFLGSTFFTWHQRNTGWVALGDRTKPGNIGELVQFGVAQNAIIRADGTVVQPTEDARFPAGNSGGGGTGSNSCDVNTDFRDGANGALWKPVSESTGNVVFLLPASYWSGPSGANRIEILDRNGGFIVNGQRRSCCPNGNRAHFDVPRRATALRPSAPLTVKLYLNNETIECRTVPDPTQRID